MAQLIEPATQISTDRTVEVTDIITSANSHAPSAGMIDTTPSAPPLTPEPTPSADAEIPEPSLRSTLKSLDKRLGPLRFGNFNVTRLELKALGAKVNGRSIRATNANIRMPDQAFLDGLSFDPAIVEARVKSVEITDSGSVATLFFEIACMRSIDAPPLFVASNPLMDSSSMDRLNKLEKAAKKLGIHRIESFENHPAWVNKSKSYALSGTGVGLQAYGIYSGFQGIMEAIKVGDKVEAVFNAGSIASEFGSLIIERGLTKGGEAMIRNGSVVFSRFSATSIGSVMSRGAGLFASVITLPFDVISAVQSFNAAAASKGKEAQDHYVSGGLSVAGAGISLVLGAAALAGFGSTAGPIGILAATVLIVGSEIYRAARIVDDIDDYIELTAHERLRSGWFAFTRQELDKDILDRHKIAKTFSDHSKQLGRSAKELIEGPYKKYLEYIVDGSFKVELKPVKIWHYQWDESAGEQPFKLDNEPVIVDSDDIIDARDGLPQNLTGIVRGSPGENKGVYWRLGDGNDQISGIKDKPNLFSYREGAKTLTGGDQDDEFYFETTSAELERTVSPARISVIDGGEGSDMLAFEGTRPGPNFSKDRESLDTLHTGYDVDLQTGKVALRSQDLSLDEITVAKITSIENISTLRRGASRITGSNQADRITANGDDHIDAGAGDDTIVIRGAACQVDGGSGQDRYYIANTNAQVTISEDGEHSSLIELDWPMENIQNWKIVDTSLVVSSLRGQHGELPEHVLTIKDVYEQIDGQRQVKNAKLRFKTKDQCELMPILPARLTDLLDHDIECLVTIVGEPAPTPQIINSGTVAITDQGPKHKFVSRTAPHVYFTAPDSNPAKTKTIHLDYEYAEISKIELSYEVEATAGVSNYTFLSYSQFNLWVKLPSKLLNITGVIRESLEKKTATSHFPNIKMASIVCAYDIVLIMRDGKSYRLTPPNIPYHEDALNPGTKSRIATECLTPRHGKYRFIRPQPIKPYLLAATPQEINFPPPPHFAIHVLHGQASSYDVYPVSNTTLSLSTPGAIAKISDASIWTIFSKKMTETVTRRDIYLEAERLRIGSTIVQLPSLEHDAPIDSISVETSTGNIYKIERVFEMLQLYVIDAQGYSSIDALLTDISAHREQEELAARITIKNISSTTLTGGTIYYNSTSNYWGIDTDPTLRIKPEDLVIDPLKID